MKARLISAAVICITAFAIGVASAKADTVQPGGRFLCDGFTGCYIITAFGAWSIDSCVGPGTVFFTGPFACAANGSAVPGLENETLVYPNATCATYYTDSFFHFFQTYEARGTITARLRGTVITLTATCGPNRL